MMPSSTSSRSSRGPFAATARPRWMASAPRARSPWCAQGSCRRARGAGSSWPRSWRAIEARRAPMKRTRIVQIAVLAGAAALAGSAPAQEPGFPGRSPIEITVLFPAGSSADVTARLLADGMAKQLGTTVLVVNRPGAGGAIGYRHTAGQKPDGHALVWNSNSISTTYHSGQLPFDYRAFDPVARVLVEAPVIAVRAESKWRSLADLLADARARPKQITVGNSGVGSHTHISSVALFK